MYNKRESRRDAIESSIIIEVLHVLWKSSTPISFLNIAENKCIKWDWKIAENNKKIWNIYAYKDSNIIFIWKS